MNTNLKDIVNQAAERMAHISEEAASRKPGGKWSAKEVLGHLIDSASVNLERMLRVCLTNNLDLHVYPQDDWVNLQAYQERSFSEVLTLWKALNLHVAHLVERIPDSSLAHTFNVPHAQNVTLKFLIEDYIAHLEHHLKQVWERTA